MGSRKRTRTNFSRRATRPIDKEIIGINTLVNSTVGVLSLRTATFPGTVVGLRWNFTVRNVSQVADQFVRWAIVLLKEGEVQGNLSSGNGGAFYQPEQNVMAFGSVTVLSATSASDRVYIFISSTKSMRKMMGGDQIVFLFQGTNDGASDCQGQIQHFYKT